MAINGRYKVEFNHIDKTATFSVVDSDDMVLVDYKGQRLENMNYDYSMLEYYRELHELVSDDGGIGIYYFPAKGY